MKLTCLRTILSKKCNRLLRQDRVFLKSPGTAVHHYSNPLCLKLAVLLHSECSIILPPKALSDQLAR